MSDAELDSVRRAYESVTGPLGVGPEATALLATVATAIADARAAYPQLGVTSEQLVARIATIAGTNVQARETIAGMFVADLLLAEAALRGDQNAHLIVGEVLQNSVRPVVQKRIGSDSASIDEVMQRVWVQMLVGNPGQTPKLLAYTATGRFLSWARVVAVRIAYTLLGQTAAHATSELEDSLVQAAIVGNQDPELQVLLTRYAPLLTRAMEQAVDTLSDKDRALLRLSLVDELSIDQIGAIYNCHRATAARWITAAKDSLSELARREFCDLTQASESEFFSVMRLLPGYFDVSMARLLAESHELSLPA